MTRKKNVDMTPSCIQEHRNALCVYMPLERPTFVGGTCSWNLTAGVDSWKKLQRANGVLSS